jgi:predicted phosphodiesterase
MNNRVFITGDTHGQIDLSKLNSKNFPQYKELSKNDYVIILGDTAIIWYGNKKDNYLINWFNKKPWTTLFIDGNHENFEALYKYPKVEFLGAKCHKISDSIYHINRGEILTINDKTFFCFGGTISIDKHSRIQGLSWWTEEEPTYKEMLYGLDNLEKYNNEVDYILTHDCPESIKQVIYPYSQLTFSINNYFENIKELTNFDNWFFGHYHLDKTVLDKYTCFYNKVLELKE